MKFCPNCGEKLEDDSKFCANCGNSVSDNVNDKTNINKTNNKSISDIINPILERPKILLLIIVVLILFIGISSIFNSSSNFSSSSSSSSNIFGGGQDITVYGVNFHIPEGFKHYELAGNPERETQFSLSSPDGKRNIAYIHIKVSDTSSAYSAEKSTIANSKMTINGKDCYVNIPSNDGDVFCAYDTNGKTVQLNVPKAYTYNNKVISYEETLAQMIK